MNILPDAATELEFFAAHNSDLGPNGHKYRREESVNLQPTAQSFTESYIKNKTYTEKTSLFYKKPSAKWLNQVIFSRPC